MSARRTPVASPVTSPVTVQDVHAAQARLAKLPDLSHGAPSCGFF
jgi:hypothetical protein